MSDKKFKFSLDCWLELLSSRFSLSNAEMSSSLEIATELGIEDVEFEFIRELERELNNGTDGIEFGWGLLYIEGTGGCGSWWAFLGE